MTRIFGDREDFAIEAGVDRLGLTIGFRRTFMTVYGHMCVWCRGISLGDIDDLHCILSEKQFRRLVIPGANGLKVDELWSEEFAGLDVVALWNFLDGMLYGYHGDVELKNSRTLEDIERNIKKWRDFNFLTYGEQFDCCKAFILRPPGDSVRILYRRDPDRMLGTGDVSRDGFVAACVEFCDWLEELEQAVPPEAATMDARQPRGTEPGDPWFPAEGVAYLQSAQFKSDAFPCLEVGCESLFWSDEAYLEFVAVCQGHDCEWFRDPLIHRSFLIRGQPDEASRRAWEELRRLCPGWPGFRPERSSGSFRDELEQQIADLQSS